MRGVGINIKGDSIKGTLISIKSSTSTVFFWPTCALVKSYKFGAGCRRCMRHDLTTRLDYLDMYHEILPKSYSCSNVITHTRTQSSATGLEILIWPELLIDLIIVIL